MNKAIWFHVPLLAMISGVHSTESLTRERLERWVVQSIGSIVLFALLLYPLLNLFGKHVFGVAGEVAFAFKGSYDDLFHTLFRRPDLAWYLRCLIVWRMGSQLLGVLPPIVQALAVLLFSISGAYASRGEFLALRTVSMFPFFHLGQLLDWGLLARLAPRQLHWTVPGWTVFLGFVCLYVSFEDNLDQLFLAVEAYPDQFVSWRALLESQCLADAHFLWARYLAAVALRGGMGLVFLIACVPSGQTWFSGLGRCARYPYLLHTALAAIPLAAWSRQRWPPAGDGGPLQGCLQAGAWLPTAFVAAAALASRPSRAAFGWAVEPRWLLGA